jgi:phage terminase small subunit
LPAKKKGTKRTKKGAKKPAPKKPKAERKLTILQQRFVDNMLVTGIGAKSARLAGIAKGNSRNQAARWMAKDDIREAIEEGEELMSATVRFDATTVLRELAILAVTDITELIDEEGHLRCDLKDVPPEMMACIQSLEEDSWNEKQFDDETGEELDPIKHTRIKVKLYDRIKAITQAGKHKAVRAFAEDIEVVDTLSATLDAILDARSRSK